MKYFIIPSLLLLSSPVFAQTGDPSLDADAAAIRGSYYSRDQVTKGVVGKSSGSFDNILGGISSGISGAVDAVKESAAPMINNVSDALGIDAKIQTAADKARLNAPPPKPKDATDIALEAVSLKSGIALNMNKSLPEVNEKMIEDVIAALPSDNLAFLKEKFEKNINKQANTFELTSKHSDMANSFSLILKRDLNYSVVNTVFFNSVFFDPQTPLEVKGALGESYYPNSCKEGVINGAMAMVCYNQGEFKTFVSMPIAPSLYLSFSVGGKDSMKIAREYILAINSKKIADAVKDKKSSNLEYAEEINKIYKDNMEKSNQNMVASPDVTTTK